MWIAATITAEEARTLVDELLPVTLRLDDEPGTERYVELEDATEVRLVEGRGLRVTCPGRVRWSLPVLGTLEMRIKALTATLVPSVQGDGASASLRFQVDIEALDFEWVPGLVDQGIASIIEKRLAAMPVAWHFGRTFTNDVVFPEAVEPPRTLATRVREPSCAVTEIAMSFAVYIGAHPSRGGAP